MESKMSDEMKRYKCRNCKNEFTKAAGATPMCPICGKAWAEEISMPHRHVKTRYEYQAKESQPDEDGWETLYDTYDLLR
jgi:uncharacterized Zn finger protein (UPF0148 family)